MKTIAGLFDNRVDAERSVTDMLDAGVPREAISLLTRDGEAVAERAVGETSTGEGAATGALAGATAGGVLGLLVGIGALAIPGIGPVIAAGPLAAAIGSGAAGTLIGAAGGAVTGGLVGAIAGAGIPDAEAEVYAEGVRRGGTLVVARLDDRLVETGARIMQSHNAVDVDERSLAWRRDGWVGFDREVEPAATEEPRYTESHARIAGGRTSDAAHDTPTEGERDDEGNLWQRSSKAGTAGGTLAGAVTGAGIGAIGGPLGAVIGGLAGAAAGAGIGAAGDAAGEAAEDMAGESTDPIIGSESPDTDQARMSRIAAAAGGATSTAGMVGGYLADSRREPDAVRRGDVVPDADTGASDTTWMESRDRQAPQLPDDESTWMESRDRARQDMSLDETARYDADDYRSAGTIRERVLDEADRTGDHGHDAGRHEGGWVDRAGVTAQQAGDRVEGATREMGDRIDDVLDRTRSHSDTPPYRSPAAAERIRDESARDADGPLGNLDEKWEESSKAGTAGGAVAGAAAGAAAGLAGGPVGAVIGGVAGAAAGAGLGAGADAAAEGIEDETLGEGEYRPTLDPGQPFDAYDADFRGHYLRHGASSGYPYDQYSIVYRYGHSLATDPIYAGRSWGAIEGDARRRWEASNPNTWERFKDSVRYAWERASGQ